MAKLTRGIRWLLAGAILFVLTALLTFLFFATKNFLELWERLQQLPEWLAYTYGGIVGAIVLFGIWLIYKLIFGSFRGNPHPVSSDKPATLEDIRQEIQTIAAAGMDTSPVQAELAELEERRRSGEVHIAFFGNISTGKSSAIKALLPEAGVETSVQGGSTREIRTYAWHTPEGDRLLLTDLPGRNEADGGLDAMARDEAIRAQVVVYVTDSDLSRSQWQDLQTLVGFGKPLLIALNKSDQYAASEQQQLAERIQARLSQLGNAPVVSEVVFIQSGGVEEVVRVYQDGREEKVTRPRPANVTALTNVLQRHIRQHLEQLAERRDASMLHLTQEKLEGTRTHYRQQQAEKIVRNGTQRAILGALASVSPGTDLVVQGVIGTRMVQELCKLYDVPIRQLDIDQFLNFSQGQLQKSVPLLLAVAGNALKAFPGVGTVAGGLVHAVAYGIIFDALGKAVAKTLEQRGTLKAANAATTFREMLSGNLEERTKTFAKLVIEQYRAKQQG